MKKGFGLAMVALLSAAAGAAATMFALRKRDEQDFSDYDDDEKFFEDCDCDDCDCQEDADDVEDLSANGDAPIDEAVEFDHYEEPVEDVDSSDRSDF